MFTCHRISVFAALFVCASTVSAATFSWNPAIDTTGPAVISKNGNLVESVNAINSNSGSTSVNGVKFYNSNALLPGNTGTNMLPGTSTGDAGLDALLSRLDFGGGTSTSASVGNGLLVSGHQYELQVFFTDLRGASSSRTMTYGDGLGNNVDVHASGGAGAFGQNATATFTGDTGSQTLAMITNGFGNAHITGYQIRDVTASGSTPVIDDGFGNGNIATGGTNGGFHLVANSAGGGTPTLTESGGLALLNTVGNNNNAGAVSNNSFDVAGQEHGIKMTFVVDSMTTQPAVNGMFLGLQNDDTTFYRSGSIGHNFGLVFDGNEGRTASNNGFALVINDIGGSGADTVLDNGDIQANSLLDGFIAEIVATPTGWSYLITGLNNPGGAPTVFSNEGTWVGEGLASNFFTTFFDDNEFLAGYVQRSGGGTTTTRFDQITVEALGAPVPEPATAMLALFGAAGLIARRRRAA